MQLPVGLSFRVDQGSFITKTTNCLWWSDDGKRLGGVGSKEIWNWAFRSEIGKGK